MSVYPERPQGSEELSAGSGQQQQADQPSAQQPDGLGVGKALIEMYGSKDKKGATPDELLAQASSLVTLREVMTTGLDENATILRVETTFPKNQEVDPYIFLHSTRETNNYLQTHPGKDVSIVSVIGMGEGSDPHSVGIRFCNGTLTMVTTSPEGQRLAMAVQSAPNNMPPFILVIDHSDPDIIASVVESIKKLGLVHGKNLFVYDNEQEAYDKVLQIRKQFLAMSEEQQQDLRKNKYK